MPLGDERDTGIVRVIMSQEIQKFAYRIARFMSQYEFALSQKEMNEMEVIMAHSLLQSKRLEPLARTSDPPSE